MRSSTVRLSPLQIGNLKGVAKPVPPDVSEQYGGLGVQGTGTPLKPSNSARGVVIANGVLFVCDEVETEVKMYRLSGGEFLGAGSLDKSPTHLAVDGNGLWVSADDHLYWSALPASASATLSFQKVAIDVPSGNKVGGISFDDSGNVYVIFQDGTHTKGKGSISQFTVTYGPNPTLSNSVEFATTANDTPEFCLWVSDSGWSG